MAGDWVYDGMMALATASEHACPGCGAAIPTDDVACRGCQRRLPRQLRRALTAAQRQRHRDHVPYLDALREARQWWVENA